MKIGIYSDLHISTTSSIMPLYYKDSKYTTRLQMIIDTSKWMYKTFSDNNVELILNGGDTLDSHTLKSPEISALSEFYSNSKGVPEIHIPGNHEVFSNNLDFYSDSILRNLSFIKIYDKPTKVNDIISVIPYMSTDNIMPDMLKSISNKILLSHIDIKGSHLRPEYIMDDGIDAEILAEYFNLTINGHLHTAEKIDTSKNLVYNIGSISSISFSDNNNYIPSICIIDTDTLEIKRFNNPFAILFRKITINTIEDLITKLNKLDSGYRYIIRVSTPYDIRDDVKSILSSKANIITYRVVSNIASNSKSIANNIKIDSIDNIEDEFINYISNNRDIINYPLDKYIEVIKSL